MSIKYRSKMTLADWLFGDVLFASLEDLFYLPSRSFMYMFCNSHDPFLT